MSRATQPLDATVAELAQELATTGAIIAAAEPLSYLGLTAEDQTAYEAAKQHLKPYERDALTRLMIFGEVFEGSPSDGDYRLFCLLATGGLRDPAQLERVARSATLADSADVWHEGKLASNHRDRAKKWARRDYIQSTIREALSRTDVEGRKRQARTEDQEPFATLTLGVKGRSRASYDALLRSPAASAWSAGQCRSGARTERRCRRAVDCGSCDGRL